MEPFTGTLRSGASADTDNLYQVTVHHPNGVRQFTAWLYPLTWEYRREYCLYAGNQQAGPVYEVVSPNDPVIEGVSENYYTETAYGTEFGEGIPGIPSFDQFQESRCFTIE